MQLLEQAFTDPSVDGPILTFNNGEVSGAEELYDTPTPALGQVSAEWDITQWAADQYIVPTNVTRNLTTDPVIGTEDYSWSTPDGKSGVDVFGTAGNYTYRLTSLDGYQKDTYLATLVTSPMDFTCDKQITFTANERIAAVYGTLGPLTYTQVQNDVVVQFNRPGSANYNPNLPTITTFLQAILATTRPVVGVDASWNQSSNTLIYNIPITTPSTEQLAWAASTGALSTVTINISAAMAGMVNYLTAAAPAGVSTSLLQDLSHWSLTGFYAGVESTNGTGASLDIQHPLITRDPSQDASLAEVTATPVTIQSGSSPSGTVSTLVASAAASLSTALGATAVVGTITGNGTSVTVDGEALTDNGTSSLITAIGGSNTITFSVSSVDGLFTGSGTNMLAVNTAAGCSTISAATGAQDTITGSVGTTGNIVYSSAAGASAFINPYAANVTILGAAGAGTETVWGGAAINDISGSLTVVDGSGYFQGGTAGGNHLTSSAMGASTLIGGGEGDVLAANGWGDVLVGGPGRSTLDGSGAVGSLSIFTAQTGASLIYGSKSQGDTVYVNQTTVRAWGFLGAFIDLHTAPDSASFSLNTTVSNTIAVGFSGAGVNYATVGDFISGLDHVVLKASSTGAFQLSSGTVSGGSGAVAYTNLTTSNGSVVTFYNTILLRSDVTMA